MLFGIQMCILSFPMLCVRCLSHPWINKCGQVWRHLVLLFHCWHWGGASSWETNPLLCDTCVVTKAKSAANLLFSFNFDWFASGQFTLHSSPRYSCKHPTKRLCGCIVMFKSTVPRQVHQDGKLILTWQTRAGTNVLSLILLSVDLSSRVALSDRKWMHRRSGILGGALCLAPITAENI